ncbi:hypothetical protein X798_06546 [Onchocerca flexuosa]|uniref:WD_REPEATS_REGION domain-containing protein n=1 Tax=Onchocerca flexuosa TaxID=387005 RepID=A0A238BLZ7_9BILA|nr:hypothetical protein X798_06546 [Onchocerca flexuosa]
MTTETPMSLDDDLAPEELSFVGFNQDATSLALGAASSYALYSTKKTEKLDLIHESCRQFSDDKKNKNNEICAQSYTNTVLAVKLNRDYMVVCLEDIVYIHTVKDMKCFICEIHNIYIMRTIPN